MQPCRRRVPTVARTWIGGYALKSLRMLNSGDILWGIHPVHKDKKLFIIELGRVKEDVQTGQSPASGAFAPDRAQTTAGLMAIGDQDRDLKGVCGALQTSWNAVSGGVFAVGP